MIVGLAMAFPCILVFGLIGYLTGYTAISVVIVGAVLILDPVIAATQRQRRWDDPRYLPDWT
jgi:hypothetical protein